MELKKISVKIKLDNCLPCVLNKLTDILLEFDNSFLEFEEGNNKKVYASYLERNECILQTHCENEKEISSFSQNFILIMANQKGGHLFLSYDFSKNIIVLEEWIENAHFFDIFHKIINILRYENSDGCYTDFKIKIKYSKS